MTRKKRYDERHERNDEETPVDETFSPDVDESLSSFDEADDEVAETIARLQRERDEAVDQYQRALADYRNYQRRSVQNEVAAAERARQELVRELIPVLDNFDLALDHAESGDPKQIAQGVRMVREGLLQTLTQRNLKRIDVQPGDEFDPNQHEAMLMEPADKIEPNHVVRLIQVGYALGDTVLRPAKVSIAQPVDERDTQTDENASEQELSEQNSHRE